MELLLLLLGVIMATCSYVKKCSFFELHSGGVK